VPIHKLPSREPSKEKILESRSLCPGGGFQGTKRAPSNRTRPRVVPIHRYPSVVCAMVAGDPTRAPSTVFQDVWAYCERSQDGLTAQAEFNAKIAGSSQSQRGHRIRKVFTLPTARTYIAEHTGDDRWGGIPGPTAFTLWFSTGPVQVLSKPRRVAIVTA
jgi:hypothetical protein